MALGPPRLARQYSHPFALSAPLGPIPISFASVLLTTRTGQTGLGKSTLVNTLFASHLVDSKGRTEPDIAPRATTPINPTSQGE
jgi:hypothetical protein